MRRYLWGTFGLCVFVAVIYKMFSLNGMPLFCIFVTGLFLLPVGNRCIGRTYKAKEEYYDLTAYMEQLLCSYKRWGTIPMALEDCRTLFPEQSQMGHALDEALYILKTGEGVRDNAILETAFASIQDLYPSRRLRLMHMFLEKADRMGGDREEELDILLQDLQNWRRRVVLYQKKKQYIRWESVLASLLSMMLCYVSVCLIPWNLRMVLLKTGLFQYATVAVVIFFMIAELVLLYRLTGTWLDTPRLTRKEQYRQQRSYKRIKKNGRGLRAYMARKVCRNEVEKEFPYWMLSLALYLQDENVYQAIQLSQGQSEGIFDGEIRLLLKNIYENPVSLQPFLDFFKELELMEVQTGMKLLYAVNSNSYVDTRRQIRFLVEQNRIVMDQSEKNRLDAQIAGMGFLKQIPMILACIKVIADLVLLLILTMRDYLIL